MPRRIKLTKSGQINLTSRFIKQLFKKKNHNLELAHLVISKASAVYQPSSSTYKDRVIRLKFSTGIFKVIFKQICSTFEM